MIKIKNRYSLFHFVGLSLLLFVYYYSQKLIKLIFVNNASVVSAVFLWLWVVLMKFSFVIYILIAVGGLENIKRELKFVFSKSDIIPGVAGGLLMFGLGYFISPFLPQTERGLPYFILAINTSTIVVSYVFYVIYAAFVEELIFRGFLWEILRVNRVGEIVILISTSVLFAIAHMSLPRFPLLLIWGIILGLLRMRQTIVGVSVIAHVTLNFVGAVIFVSTFL